MFVNNISNGNVDGNFSDIFGNVASLAAVTFCHIPQFFLQVIASKLCVDSSNVRHAIKSMCIAITGYWHQRFQHDGQVNEQEIICRGKSQRCKNLMKLLTSIHEYLR